MYEIRGWWCEARQTWQGGGTRPARHYRVVVRGPPDITLPPSTTPAQITSWKTMIGRPELISQIMDLTLPCVTSVVQLTLVRKNRGQYTRVIRKLKRIQQMQLERKILLFADRTDSGGTFYITLHNTRTWSPWGVWVTSPDRQPSTSHWFLNVVKEKETLPAGAIWRLQLIKCVNGVALRALAGPLLIISHHRLVPDTLPEDC